MEVLRKKSEKFSREEIKNKTQMEKNVVNETAETARKQEIWEELWKFCEKLEKIANSCKETEKKIQTLLLLSKLRLV